jgi:hypothetical protein
LIDNLGIDGTFCATSQVVPGPLPEPIDLSNYNGGDRHLQGFDDEPVRITSVTFFEVDRNGTDYVNSTYQETNLEDGDIISFPSISSQLNTDQPLNEQLDVFPGGVSLRLIGPNADGDFVQMTVLWQYSLEECSAISLEVGDAIGWISLEEYIPPLNAFCPAAPSPAPPAPSAAVPSVAPSGRPSKVR